MILTLAESSPSEETHKSPLAVCLWGFPPLGLTAGSSYLERTFVRGPFIGVIAEKIKSGHVNEVVVGQQCKQQHPCSDSYTVVR